MREGRVDSKLTHRHPRSRATCGGEATRAWSGVVDLGGDRLEVRGRRLYEEARGYSARVARRTHDE